MGEIRMNADEQISDVCATTPPLAVTEELADLPAAPIVATEVFVDSSPRQPPAGLLRRGDCLVLLVVCLGCISLATVHWVRLTCSIVPPADLLRPATANPYRVEINQATWVELLQLEGLGETTARQVVSDRESRGLFRDVDDLQRVKGIGPATLAKLRPQVTCTVANTPSDSASQTARPTTKKNRKR